MLLARTVHHLGPSGPENPDELVYTEIKYLSNRRFWTPTRVDSIRAPIMLSRAHLAFVQPPLMDYDLHGHTHGLINLRKLQVGHMRVRLTTIAHE